MAERPHYRPPQTKARHSNQKRPTPAKAARVSPARSAAFHILEKVSQGKAHSDDLLYSPAVSQLSQEDRNLTTTLVLGILRWQIALDARVRPLLQRPDMELPDGVQIALRLGAFQLLHLDRIPAHAAINESVELTRDSGNGHASGMVNAILRKVATAGIAGKKLHESTAGLAERLGHPLWLVERWVKHYGREAALAICEFDQQEPGCGELFAASDGAESGNLPVIDDGSRLVAEIAAASVPEPHRIWDCCAAPGGKAIILAHRHHQAKLLATDASVRRLRSLAERLARETPNANIETKVADAVDISAIDGEFDLILCDVPCSGTGTIARNPEIRHLLQPADLHRQAERQQAILKSSLAHLAPGGRLIYSTCSLEPEENEQVVEAVIKQANGSFTRLSVTPALDEVKARSTLAESTDLSSCVRDGYLRTLPGSNFQGDGFFAAVLART